MPRNTSLSLKDIVKVQNDNLRTIGSKIIYLTIRNNADRNGWATISLSELASTACLTRRGVVNILNRMQECGLIEKQYDHSSHDAKNKYRAITL
jgi:hypothetical protein